jgi:3-hydroxyisobutyrate dehydrogenase
MNKDIRYAQAAAAEHGVTLSTAAVTGQLFDKAEQQGLGEKDMSSVVEVLRDNKP